MILLKRPLAKKKNDLKVYLLFGPCFNTKFELFLNKEENQIKCLPVFRQK